MKVLLDTHAFIWWDSDPTKLSPQARAACEDRTNVVLFSVASVWGMQIKVLPDLAKTTFVVLTSARRIAARRARARRWPTRQPIRMNIE